MTLTIDYERARTVAPILYEEFRSNGIFGKKDMPEDITPCGMSVGSREHLLFLTLTVSIDYQRDAHALWDSARATYEDPVTRYLFEPGELTSVPFTTMMDDMQKHGLSKKKRQDAWIWRTVAVTFNKKWKNDPQEFLSDCSWDAMTILHRLRQDQHFDGKKMAWDFPFLRGQKIGPLWVKMLKDNGRIEDIRNLEQVPIPVDVHVARATLAIGVVRGHYSGLHSGVFPAIREAWKEGVAGLSTADGPMIALDVDEPLWHLSKFGCRKRDPVTGECPVMDACIMQGYCNGGGIHVNKSGITLNTAGTPKIETLKRWLNGRFQ